MPIIYQSQTGTTDDGYVAMQGQPTWASARDGAGNIKSTALAQYSAGTAVTRLSGRRGSNLYTVIRSFFCFDTSGVTSAVSAATIKIRGYSTNTGSVIAVKSTAFGGDGGTALANGDFNAISGYSSGSSLAGSATVYGPQKTTTNWSTSGYNDFTGTSDLLTDMQNNDVVIICLMDYTNDYLNVALTSDVSLRCGMYYAEASSDPSATFDPKIDYTLATGATVHSVNGVAEANIATIKGVAHANIAEVNTVTFD